MGRKENRIKKVLPNILGDSLIKGILLLFISSELFAEKVFVRENELVFDTSNKLIWQDDVFSGNTKLDYENAVIYCNNLKLAKYTDWRLPTYDEILTIGDEDSYRPSINSIFKFVYSGHYWASTPISSESNFMRSILYISQPGIFWSKNKGLDTHHVRRYFFSDQETYAADRTGKGYVRCVREDNK